MLVAMDQPMPVAEEPKQEAPGPLWIGPEIERRRTEGRIPDGYVLRAAQVIFDVGEPPRVLLDEEVQVVAMVRAKRPVAKGEAITDADFEEIAVMQLPPDRPDSGHVTLIDHNGYWWVSFDFRLNAQRIDRTLRGSISRRNPMPRDSESYGRQTDGPRGRPKP
jgi:hypothetical protein